MVVRKPTGLKNGGWLDFQGTLCGNRIHSKSPLNKKNEQNKNPSGKLLLNHCLWNIQSLIFLERISTLPFFEGNKTRVLEVSTRLFTKKKAKGHIAVLNDSTKARGKIFMTLRAKYMIPSLRRNPKKSLGNLGVFLNAVGSTGPRAFPGPADSFCYYQELLDDFLVGIPTSQPSFARILGIPGCRSKWDNLKPLEVVATIKKNGGSFWMMINPY